MKDILDQVRSQVEQIESDEVKTSLDSLLGKIQSEYQMLDSKLKLTTKQSITRKQKLNQLYQKMNQFDTLRLKTGQYEQQIQKLKQYQNKAIQQKKLVNNKIKTLFDVKLSNETHKDYQKYKAISSQFNFESEDQHVLDSNKKVYDILQLAGTFGTQSIGKLINTLPPSTGKDVKKPGSR